MITLILVLFMLFILLGVAFTITGAFLKALLWLCIFLPVGLCLCVTGIILCCTILFIPIGIMLLKAGAHVILPGI